MMEGIHFDPKWTEQDEIKSLQQENADLRQQFEQVTERLEQSFTQAEYMKEELQAQLEASQAREAALADALEATEAVKSYMVMPKAYWEDNWTDEEYQQYEAAEQRYIAVKKALSATPAQAMGRQKAMDKVVEVARRLRELQEAIT